MKLAAFYEQVKLAAERIRPYVRYTPVEPSVFLSDMADGSQVYIKMESEQVTGSFKARGACNKVLNLLEENDESVRKSGIVLASTGNHGLACLYIMKKVGLSGTVFCPSTISPLKEASLRKQGAQLVKCGPDAVSGENAARKKSIEEGIPFVSPYNDELVMAGQGTIGLELLEQLPAVDAVFVAVGGGGLVAGIAAYIKHLKPSVQIIGCSPKNSKVMYESVRAGKLIYEESLDTLSEGTSGALEDGCITFPVCAEYVDDWVLAEEEEIAQALYLLLRDQHKLVEGSAAMAVACFIKTAEKYKGKTVAIVSCGANISLDVVKPIIDKYHGNKDAY